EYQIRLTVGKEVRTCALYVEEDPRIILKPAQLRAHFEASARLYRLQSSFQEASRAIESLRSQLTDNQKEETFKRSPQDVKDAVAAVDTKIKDLQAIASPPRRG